MRRDVFRLECLIGEMILAVAVWKEEKQHAGLKEVIAKYSDIPPLVILKTDVQRRGVFFTDAALSKVDKDIHQLRGRLLCSVRVTANLRLCRSP